VLRDKQLDLCPPSNFNDVFEGSMARLTHYTPEAGLDLVAKIASVRHGDPLEKARSILERNMPETDQLCGLRRHASGNSI
jgi:hypothetical protein